MTRLVYPFTAIVRQDAMRAALLLNAVDPAIGGVLIRGTKGTGKSTAARGLAPLLPAIGVVEGCPFNSHPAAPVSMAGVAVAGSAGQESGRAITRPMPFVELPLNATEDRLVGTLHIEKALRSGERQFEPGLLAAANRGVLYVDEVNLLDDHLVDMLLDAAASGVNVVEREGISFQHPAQFLLIGTMNPEEGELRPQFLDRFGLAVAVERIADLAARESIVRRHLSFQADPVAFAREWQDAERGVARQIVRAREMLERVSVPEALLAFAVKLTQQLNVPGHRADITILKAARAHAAFLEKRAADWEDLAEAARLALPHRMAASPLDAPEQLQEKIGAALREILDGGAEDGPPIDAEPATADLEDMAETVQVPGSHAAGSIVFSFLKKKTAKPSLMPTG